MLHIRCRLLNLKRRTIQINLKLSHFFVSNILKQGQYNLRLTPFAVLQKRIFNLKIAELLKMLVFDDLSAIMLMFFSEKKSIQFNLFCEKKSKIE